MRIKVDVQLEDEQWEQLKIAALKHDITPEELFEIITHCWINNRPLFCNDPKLEEKLTKEISDWRKRMEP